MKSKIVILLVVVIAVLSITSSMLTAPKNRQRPNQAQDNKRIEKLEEKEKQGRINLVEAAELGKSRGQKRIVVPALATLYLGTASSADELDQKLADYTVVVAKLVDKKSYMRDVAVVRTWNKFQIVDTLHNAPPRPLYVTWPSIPEELLPLNEDEILVHTEGGAVTIDGVEVAQADSDVAAFRKSQKYVLVLSLDPQSKIGLVELGPQSYLHINPDESLNEAMDNYLLQQVIKRHHGGSVGKFKDKLKTRRSS